MSPLPLQVIRFVDAEGKGIISRKDRVWTTSGMAQRMPKALAAAKRPVPDCLEDLADSQ
jgi:hypothetical protein